MKKRVAIGVTALLTATWVLLVDVLQFPAWGWLALGLPSFVFSAVAATVVARVSSGGRATPTDSVAIAMATGFAAAATVAFRILFTFNNGDPERLVLFWGYLVVFGIGLTAIATAVAVAASRLVARSTAQEG